MVVMHASGQQLCQMVHDAGLQHDADICPQTVWATG